MNQVQQPRILVLLTAELDTRYNMRCYRFISHLVANTRADITLLGWDSALQFSGWGSIGQFRVYKECWDGVPVTMIGLPKPYLSDGSKVWSMPSFLIDVYRVSVAYLTLTRLNLRFDFAFAMFPWVGTAAALLKRRRMFSTLIYDDSDHFAEFAKDWPRRWFVDRLERFTALSSDHVFAVSGPLLALRREQGCKDDDLHYSPNGVEVAHFSRVQVDTESQLLLYVGALSSWIGMDKVLYALKELTPEFPSLRLRVLGSGTHEDDLKALTVELGLTKRVEFAGRIPYHELPSYMSGACLGLALHPPSELLRYAAPMKIGDYMAAGLPVLATDIGDLGTYIRDSGAGWAIPHTVADIVATLRQALHNPRTLAEMGDAAHRYVRDKTWHSIFADMLRSVGL